MNRRSYIVALFTLVIIARVDAAVLYTTDFDPNDGWNGAGADSFDATAGEITLNFAQESEEPGPGFGTFVSPVFDFSPDEPYTITSVVFDFYYASTAPSWLVIQIGSGSFSIYRALTWINGVNTLHLFSSAGWSGDTAQFNTIMTDLTFVELSVGRSGSEEQSFSLQHFQIMTDEIPSPPSAIPEPNTISLILLLVLVFLFIRRMRIPMEMSS